MIPHCYTTKLLRDFAQKNVKSKQTNDRYPQFKQLHFTAGDAEQFEKYRGDCKSEVQLNKTVKPESLFHSVVDENVFHGTLSRPTITDTFHYIFHKFKKGIYVKIRDGRLATFLPFSNANFVNEYSDKLGKPSDHIKILRKVSSHSKYKFNPKKVNGVPEMWYANNCLLRHEYPIAENDTNVSVIFDFLKVLVDEREIPDCDFFINKRDFPILAEGKFEPYNHIFDSKTHPLLSHKYDRYAPICSFSAGKNHSDILLPTPDDWIRVSACEHRFFCRASNDYKSAPCVPWTQKRNIAVWRGSSTGAGVTAKTNQRIHLSKLANNLMLSGSNVVIDAGLTSWKTRVRKLQGARGLQTINIEALNIPLVPKLEFSRFGEYKYIIHVNGHSSAYRMGAEFSFGSVMLIVEGEHKLWFQRFLEDGVNFVSIKADLSNLVEKVEWLKKNDNQSRQIADNGLAFFNKYLGKKGILDYATNTIKEMCCKMPLDKWVDGSTAVRPNFAVPSMPIKKLVFVKDIKKSRKSEIYLAENSDGNRLVVKKVAHFNSRDEYLVGRHIANKISGCVQSVGYNFEDNSVVTEHVVGETFLNWIIGENFSVKKFFSIVYKTAVIIKDAQEKYRFVHNDLTPSNIVIENSVPVLIDFGRSRGVDDVGNTFCSIKNLSEFSSTQDMRILIMTSLFHVCRRANLKDVDKILRLARFVMPKKPENVYDVIKFTRLESKFSRLTAATTHPVPSPADVLFELMPFSSDIEDSRCLTGFFETKQRAYKILRNLNADIRDMAEYFIFFMKGFDRGGKGKKQMTRLVYLTMKQLAPMKKWRLAWMKNGLRLAHRCLHGEKSTLEKLLASHREMILFMPPHNLSRSDVADIVKIGRLKCNTVKKYFVLTEFKKIFRIIK